MIQCYLHTIWIHIHQKKLGAFSWHVKTKDVNVEISDQSWCAALSTTATTCRRGKENFVGITWIVEWSYSSKSVSLNI